MITITLPDATAFETEELVKESDLVPEEAKNIELALYENPLDYSLLFDQEPGDLMPYEFEWLFEVEALEDYVFIRNLEACERLCEYNYQWDCATETCIGRDLWYRFTGLLKGGWYAGPEGFWETIVSVSDNGQYGSYSKVGSYNSVLYPANYPFPASSCRYYDRAIQIHSLNPDCCEGELHFLSSTSPGTLWSGWYEGDPNGCSSFNYGPSSPEAGPLVSNLPLEPLFTPSVAEFKNMKTDEIVKGINFGGDKIYLVGTVIVKAPEEGESISYSGGRATLNPWGLTADISNAWEVTDRTFYADDTWTAEVTNKFSGEVVSGVLEFKLNGFYYTTACDSINVLAECGGYKIEDTWEGQQSNEWKRLIHTDNTLPHEILKKTTTHSDVNAGAGSDFVHLSTLEWCYGKPNPCYEEGGNDDYCAVYGGASLLGDVVCGNYTSTPYDPQDPEGSKARFHAAFPPSLDWAKGALLGLISDRNWLRYTITWGPINYPNYEPDPVGMNQNCSITDIITFQS